MAYIAHGPGLWLLGQRYPSGARLENAIAMGVTLAAALGLFALHAGWSGALAFAVGHILWGWRLSRWLKRAWATHVPPST